MMMRKTSIVLAGILAFTLCIPVTVMADEVPADPSGETQTGGLDTLFGDGGLLSGLFGDDGLLSDISPEDIDAGQIIQTVGNVLEDPDSMLNQTIENVKDLVTEEDGSIDWKKVGETAGDLFSFFSGGDTGSISDEELDDLFLQFDNMDAAMKEYVFDRNAAFLESGDVQIFSKKTAYTDDIDQNEIRVLAEFSQDNFMIEDDQMKYLCGCAEPMLLTLVREADGSYSVTDAEFTEDGEGFDASLEVLCDEVGISTDDYYSFVVFDAYNDADAVAEYLEEHPEISAAEYMGEMKTAEELRAMSDAYVDSFFGDTEEEASAV